MPQPAGGAGAAPDATVQTGQVDPDAVQADRERLADEAEQAAKTIEAVLAGTKESLTTAKAEAKRLRSEADKGAKG